MCDCPSEQELLEDYVALRRGLRNLLSHHNVFSNPLVEDEWIVSELRGLLVKSERYLHDLTPGGSEYFANPKRCAAYVRERLDSSQRLLTQACLERNRAREQVEQLQAELDTNADTIARLKRESIYEDD